MKSIFILPALVLQVLFAAGQWSNTSNTFTHDLDMPVCTVTGDQTNAMVIKSYPDGGYFIVWEDKRAGFYSAGQIFAQKYDRDGNRLWPDTGVVISKSTNPQRFTSPSTQDYRNRKVAASDQVGGLYITYTDDSASQYSWKRVCVQHLKPDGERVFGGAGYVIAQTPSFESYNFSTPQLIGDNEGGFYLSYIRVGDHANDYVYVFCFKDDNGTIKQLGGGIVNANAITEIISSPCGDYKYDLLYPGTTVSDYNIWPDLQGNCSVVITMYGNNGQQGNILCYNKVWKVKEDHISVISRVLADRSPSSDTIIYHKGDVDILYKIRINPINAQCISGQNIYKWVDDSVIGKGFRVLDQGASGYYFPKGTTLTTGGNINAELVTYSRREIVNGTVTDANLVAVAFDDEIYKEVPYPSDSNENAYYGLNTTKPAGLDSLTYFRDTLLPAGINAYDFSLSGGGSHAYLAGLFTEKLSDNASHVRLQHISIEKSATGEYRMKYETGTKNGVLIGSELNTGFGSSAIDYDFPVVTANKTGNALFTINELGRYTRISPVFKGAQLAWGAMGTPIGSAQVNNAYISVTLPFVALDSTDGSGVISWYDSRNAAAGKGSNIYMRHLDNLNVESYTPPARKVLPYPTGGFIANPAFLTGASKTYSTIDMFNSVEGTLSPVVEILDNYNLGAVPVGVYEHNDAIRYTNGKPYLNRNYVVTPENNPNGAADINMRLYFTTAAFDALKLADPTITDPGSLVVIKQPNAGGIPSAYVPSGSDMEILPDSWSAVDGGYYVEVLVKGFSNFFIQKGSGVLPVTWLGIQARWEDADNARVSWQVGDQQNVKDYTVQQSTDGIVYSDKSSVPASAIGSYNCIVPASGKDLTYYRVLQRDLDNKFSYSKTVILRSQDVVSLSAYPNPAKDKLFIQVAKGDKQLEVQDINGRIVLRLDIYGEVNQQVNVSNLGKGMYLLTVKGNEGRRTIRFVKE